MNNFKGFEGFDEIVKYCKRENRKEDFEDARDSSIDYAREAAEELQKIYGFGMKVSETDSYAMVTMPVDDFKSKIQLAYLNGLQKGRDSGGLERLFSDVQLKR